MGTSRLGNQHSRRVAPDTTSPSEPQEEPSRRTSPYEEAGLVNRSVHWWMNSSLTKARQSGLQPVDIFDPPSWESSKTITDMLNKRWEPYDKRSKPSLFRCIIRANAGAFLLVFFISLSMVALKFAQPIIVSRLVTFYDGQPTLPLLDVMLTVGLLLLSNIAVLLLYSANEFVKGLVAMRMRTACTGMTFKKLMRLSTQAMHRSSSGRIINILSTDAERFVLLGRAAESIMTGPLEILLFIVFVSFELDEATPAFAVITLLIIIIHCLIGTKQGDRRRRAAEQTDRRAAMMSEVLTAIRVIKMQCWEQPITARARLLRSTESKKLLLADTWMCVNLTMSYHTGRMFVYVATVSSLFYNVQISPQSAIKIIGWVKMIEMSVLIALPVFFSVIFDISASVGRIQDFLLDEDVEKDDEGEETNGSYVMLKNVFASWDRDGEVGDNFHLADVTLEAGKKDHKRVAVSENNQLIVVAGPVGCGKSSLLLAVLGELQLKSGFRHIRGQVAYFPQEPWVTSGTLRHNVTMGAPFDESRYYEVIKMTCLSEDMSSFPHGDLTLIGELGLSLSGGQKARVNLARALYTDADIYLLDDPFSAVDAKVGWKMFHSCIKYHLKEKLCILVTHNLQYSHFADHIILMDKVAEVVEVMADDEMGRGKLSRDTVLHYLWAGRAHVILPVCTLLLSVSQACGIFSDWWITHWTLIVVEPNNRSDTNRTHQVGITDMSVSNTTFLALYTGMLLVSMTSGVLCAVLTCKMTSLAANNLYDDMFTRVLHAPMSFFEKWPVGRILTRFSRDMGFIDDMMPFSITFLSNELANIIGALTFTAAILPWTLVASVLFVLSLIAIRQYVMAGARDIRRLEANRRSPTFTLLYSCMKGIHVIRAHQLEERMVSEAHDVVDAHTGAWHMLLACQRWLAVRSDMAAYFYLTLVLLLMPLLPFDGPSASSFSLALFYLIRLIGTTAISTRESADLEIHMMCVERVRQYSLLPQEASLYTTLRPPSTWPSYGGVHLSNVSVSYSQGPKVLKDINLKIQPYEKIGIVGRTGSGKTTLMMALLRIQEPEGHVIIDGISTKDLGLADIRKNISVIPQDPVLFSGTLRSNIDPFSEYSEAKIQTVLRQVELWTTVSEMKHGLDTEMLEGGGNFSVGQRQLLCLGRALLKQSKLLIIDEATANVDHRTDLLIQKTLKEEFSNCTVLNIAHRLHTIIDYDRVLVLDHGRVVQCDHAHTLLQDASGLFFAMVTQTGTGYASDLREQASQAFLTTRVDEKKH